MLTINEAFRKFKSRLELNEREQADAARRQQEIRALVDDGFAVDDAFLTGSYKRWTKTKPLKDVDIFCVLGEAERRYRSQTPADLLGAFETLLIKAYGRGAVLSVARSRSTSGSTPSTT